MFLNKPPGRPHSSKAPRGMCLWALLLAAVGCSQRMSDQPRIEPLEASTVFADGMGSRHPVMGTIPRGPSRHEIVHHSSHFVSGTVEGRVVDELPPEVLDRWTLGELLERGQHRFGVYCVYCHDQLGSGKGFVPQRGFPAPPTYHSPRVRSLPLGEIFRVITNGKGRMPPYGPQVDIADRWAIAAYIRTLQFSQYADLNGLEADDARALEAPAESDEGGPAAETR